jgi:hypothetical protein
MIDPRGDGPRRTARRIVDELVDDLTDRRGLGQEWEQIDDVIRLEIVNVWLDIAEREVIGYLEEMGI